MGGTPALVAGVLLAEYLALAVIAGAAGLVALLTAPLLTSPGAGLLGAAGAPQLTPPVIALVIGVALAVATLASYVPALRAAHQHRQPPRRRRPPARRIHRCPACRIAIATRSLAR